MKQFKKCQEYHDNPGCTSVDRNKTTFSNLPKLILIGLLSIVLMLVMTACSNDAGADKKEPIIFADGGWDSLKFHNEIAGIIISEGYGYETETISGSTAALMKGIEQEEIDIHMELWSENLGDTYFDGVENGDYIQLSVNFDDNFQGLYVPTYVIEGDSARGIDPIAPDLKYITDLPDYWEVFKDPEDEGKGRIIGSISGWTVDEILYEGIQKYGLDDHYNYFRPGSESSINISLASAYEKGEPWIGYNYEPNWVMGKYDMTPILEEVEDGPLSSIGAQDIDIISNKSLPERAPDVVDFLKKYKTSSLIANNALVYIQDEKASAHDAAIKFLHENEDIWTTWVPKEIAQKVKEAIK